MTELTCQTLLHALSAVATAAPESGWARAVEFVTGTYDFALWVGLGSALVGLCCALLGSFLVLRRMSLIGDVLGHAMLPGVVLGFMVAGTKALLPLYLGALGTGVLAALCFGFIVAHSRTRPDAALGLVLTTFFGLGIVLMASVQNDPSGQQAGLTNFLFGNALALQPVEVGILAVLAVVSIACVVTFYRPLAALCFDPLFARTIGLPIRVVHYGLMTLTSLVTVASIQSVGVVLVVAMLITPAATAFLLVRRLPGMLALSATIGTASGYLGAMLSYVFTGFSSGPTMVLVASAFFTLAVVFGPRGLLPMWLRRRRRDRREHTRTENAPVPSR